MIAVLVQQQLPLQLKFPHETAPERPQWALSTTTQSCAGMRAVRTSEILYYGISE